MRDYQITERARFIVADEARSDAAPIVYAHGWRTNAEKDLFDRGLRAAVAERLAGRGELVGLLSMVPDEERTDFGDWHSCAVYARVWSGRPLVVHSGAYRLVADLIDDGCAPPVVILLDALYGQTDAFRRYVAAGGTLINVVSEASESVMGATDRLEQLLANADQSRYRMALSSASHGDLVELMESAFRALETL